MKRSAAELRRGLPTGALNGASRGALTGARTTARTAPWLLVVLAILAGAASDSRASDWPMWRYDQRRSNAAADELPTDLRPRWSRQLPAPHPAWPASQEKLQFDAACQPIVSGKRLIVGGTVNDAITAYDTESGRELWRFYTDGPVRFAPVARGEWVYATSDDGYLYCLEAATGELRWKVRGGPSDRRILGNDRLISSWPARGGPVVADDTVYFAASIWPFMGIFIHAVDADSGETRWLNSEIGSAWTVHPHGAPSFGSLVPQGYLTVSGDNLIVPGGRSLPAVFDRHTGRLRHFQFGGKGDGGWHAAANDDFYVVGDSVLDLRDGGQVGAAEADVLTERRLVSSSTLYLLGDQLRDVEQPDRRGNLVRRSEWVVRRQEKLPLADRRVLAMAGSQLIVSSDNRISLLALGTGESPGDPKEESAPNNEKAPNNESAESEGSKTSEPLWTAPVADRPVTAIAADDKLFLVTSTGQLVCFASGDGEDNGEVDGEARHWPLENPPRFSVPSEAGAARQEAPLAATRGILGPDADKPGYAIAWGLGGEELIGDVLRHSRWQVIVIDSDAERVDAFRRRMDAAGLYGTRVVAHAGSLDAFDPPPYMARAVIGEELSAGSIDWRVAAEKLVKPLRPYGGRAYLRLSDAQHEALAQALRDRPIPGVEWTREENATVVRRAGPLPGSSPWTHQYADAANSVVSQDRLVKSPLGLLWFGGPSNDEILPRHGHGPSPQVAGGRLLIEGPDLLRCVDVYTGLVIWERVLPGLGKYYDTTRHFAGAGEIGSNYVTLEDAVYVVYGDAILELDVESGRTRRRFTVAGAETVADGDRAGDGDGGGNGEAATAESDTWGFLAAEGDLLLATSRPVEVEASEQPPAGGAPAGGPLGGGPLGGALRSGRYASSSRRLVAFDRRTGKPRWTREARYVFRHNTIVIAAGKVFCIDGMSSAQLDVLRRRGVEPEAKPRLLALDQRTGREIWATDEDVFGTFLNYSERYDVLLQAGSAYRDRARDEVDTGMVAYRGRDGQVLWRDLERKHGGPCLLWRDKIITNGGGGFQLELLTGKPTGWSYERMYGCNTAIGSEHLLTFRSGAAGFCDLTSDSGTGNIGGFRSSCTANLVVADGVLNAPDYTRTCVCAYQNQCSLALVHMPEAEVWTFSSRQKPPEALGVNLGAPGDRRADDGVMWYEFPSIGGESPELPITLHGEPLRSVRHHAALLRTSEAEAETDSTDWIAASCVVGLRRLEYTLPSESATSVARKGTTCTVRLHFAELEGRAPGERVFDVSIAGTRQVETVDIRRQAGGPLRPLVREFRGVPATAPLVIEFTPRVGEPCLSGIQVLEE